MQSERKSVIPETIAQIKTPWPVVGDYLPVYLHSKNPALVPNPLPGKPKKAPVKVIRNDTKPRATPPVYGMIAPTPI